MMGTNQEQQELFSYQINLDERVRSEHPLRKVREHIDFMFVRGEVAGCYGYNGNVSVDPVVIMKMMFLLFFDDVASERELMRVIPERLDYMWFLGYGLNDSIPDHSVLSKARSRWGVEVFESLFVRIVAQCVDQDLVRAEKRLQSHLHRRVVQTGAVQVEVGDHPADAAGAVENDRGEPERMVHRAG